MTRHEFFCQRLRELGVFNKDADHAGFLGKWVEELSATFASQSHSGMSANLTLELFNQLMKEWQDGCERPKRLVEKEI